MPSYTIEWVGADPHEFQGTNSWAIAGVGPDGKFKKTKLERPTSAPPPHKGEVIEGTLDAHPRMDAPVQLLSEANGSTPSEATGANLTGGNTRSGGDPRGDKIDRDVAFKGAVAIVASHDGTKNEPAAIVAGVVGDLTEALLPIVRGESPTEQPPPLDTAESVQADAETADGDIPF